MVRNKYYIKTNKILKKAPQHTQNKILIKNKCPPKNSAKIEKNHYAVVALLLSLYRPGSKPMEIKIAGVQCTCTCP